MGQGRVDGLVVFSSCFLHVVNFAPDSLRDMVDFAPDGLWGGCFTLCLCFAMSECSPSARRLSCYSTYGVLLSYRNKCSALEPLG